MTLTSLVGRPCGHIAQIIPNRLYFGSFYEIPKNDDHTVHVNIDDEVHYHAFYNDFGPVNLGELHKACLFIDNLYKNNPKRRLVICTDANDTNRVNGAYIVASYMVVFHGLSADQAYLRVQRAEPPAYIGFIDAALGEPSYLLHLQHTIKAVEKAIKYNWLNFETFDRDEYEYYERVENGDLNWIIPNKILSFCGPHDSSYVHNGYPYHGPDVYFDYFRENGVSTIVRLNTKLYCRNKFVNAGFDHKDLFFIDGSTPSEAIVLKFFEIVDNAKGAVAVHCKAGLGRTGTLIACWMMKEYKMTAPQCMAWLRICRPGSVIGPQQQFLIDKQSWCWRFGLQQNRTKSPTRKETKTEVVELSLDDKPRSGKSRNIYDETAVNDKGQSQGDRLNEMKLRSQRATSVTNNNPVPLSTAQPVSPRFTSATTPIKQLKISTVPKVRAVENVPNTRRQLNLKMPISKVIVATTPNNNRILSSRSPRSQPYNHSSNVSTKYALRPRRTLTSPERFNPAPDPTRSTLERMLAKYSPTVGNYSSRI